MTEGSVYTLSGFDVTRSSPKYRLSDAPVAIRFNDGTLFEKLAMIARTIPTEHFCFRPYDQILELANTGKQLPDIMGEFCAIRSTITDRIPGAQRVMLNLRLGRDTTVCVSIFDSLALAFHSKLDGYRREPRFVVVTAVNPKLVSGKLYLNGTSAANCQVVIQTSQGLHQSTSALQEVMVKSPVPETDKGPLRRSRRTESVPLLSTPSSSTATKRSRKKKISDERQPWLKEQFLPLTPPTLLGCRRDVDRIKETNGQLARQNRRNIRARKRNKALQQEIQHNADTILAVQNNTINVVDSERDNRRIARALRMERLINKRVATTKKLSDERRPWLNEQYHALTTPTMVGGILDVDRFNVTNGKLARQQRRLIRATRSRKAPQQGERYNEHNVLPVQDDNSNVADSERGSNHPNPP
ncbi:hypothetical protein DY000_02053533 [Brassica cretica]|uniref:Uncharacterized protein n=1 Tax=Brassica cretica TaxID=69181 RepID=A0ABQ7AEU1_BRACR|nr:hypothetical protein DY000_02053533 [Brassica cretica]